MPKLTVDGIEVEVPAGATLLQACEAAGREIPRFCYHERLSIAGNCRMCLVDLEKSPKPVASCAMPAADGQVVSTTTPRVRKAREGVMEFLLINHPLDCPICDQGGECDLQDQAVAYGRGGSRFQENKRAVTEKNMGPLVKTVMTRCIQCTRCVRFATEVAGVEELGVVFRGEQEQITSYLQKSLTSEIQGNIIDLCPVGALTSGPTAYSARSWEIAQVPGIDVMDALGSNVVFGVRGMQVMRVQPSVNDDVNEEWLSDKGRFAIDGLLRHRLDRPYVRENGRLREASWGEAFAAVRTGLEKLRGEEIGGLVGDLADLESMVAFKDFLEGLGAHRIESRQDHMVIDPNNAASYRFNSGLNGIESADVILLVGTNPRWEAPLLNTRLRRAVRQGGTRIFAIGPVCDLTYPVTWLGDDAALMGALPEAVVAALSEAQRPAMILGAGGLASPGVYDAALDIAQRFSLIREGWNGWNVLHTAAARVGALDLGLAVPGGRDALFADVKDERVRALFLLGADEIHSPDLAKPFVVYIGTHGDLGVRHADVILPAAAYTEKAGTWVNLEGRVQRSEAAVPPPGDAREDWTILRALSDVVGQRLPYDSLSALRARMATQWPHLARTGLTPIPWEMPAKAGIALRGGEIALPVGNYYLTNPIARASETMAACVRDILGQGEDMGAKRVNAS